MNYKWAMDRFDRGIASFIHSRRYFAMAEEPVLQLSEVDFARTPWMLMCWHLESVKNDRWTLSFFLELFGLKYDTFINVFVPHMAKYEQEYSFEILIPLELKAMIVLHWECHDGLAVSRKVWRRYSGVRYEQCQFLHDVLYAKCLETYLELYRGTTHEFQYYV